MKNIGIVRKVDNLGRIVLPKELQKTYHYMTNDMFEIFTDGDYIILKKYETTCAICGLDNEMMIFKDKKVCLSCLEEVRNTSQ